MATKKRNATAGCKELKKLVDDGDVKFDLLTRTSHGDEQDYSSLHLVKILSSVGKSPCDFLGPQTHCRLLAKNVAEEGGQWDLYLVNCHYGPPCAFLQT